MSEYLAKVSRARRPDEAFLDNQYSRSHEWSFDGGLTVPASSSPHVVPQPCSVEAIANSVKTRVTAEVVG